MTALNRQATTFRRVHTKSFSIDRLSRGDFFSPDFQKSSWQITNQMHPCTGWCLHLHDHHRLSRSRASIPCRKSQSGSLAQLYDRLARSAAVFRPQPMHVAFIPPITILSFRTRSHFACPHTISRVPSIHPTRTFACLTNQQQFQPILHSLQTQITPILSVQSHDVLLTAALLAAAGLWLLLWQTMTSKNLVPSSVTRKVIHVSCGSLFVAIWPLYSDVFSARLLAAIVPTCFISLLAVSGYAREDETTRAALGRAISREGKAADALQGPLYYSFVLTLVSLLLFKSPIAVIVIAQLCFGDGAAEIIGKRFGASFPWGFPWTGDKTIVGSSAFVLAALAASCAGLTWWNYWNLVDASVLSPVTFFSLATISAACAATELAPKELAVDDNLTVAATAAAMSVILFGWWPF